MGIRSLAKQSPFNKSLHLSRAVCAGANPRVFCFLFMSSKKAFPGRYDFQVCVSDMATLFKCRDL